MSDYIPKEFVEKAKQVDLLTYFMEVNPNELVRKGTDTYSLKTHDSVIISNGLWHRFSTNEGGRNALDYLIKVEKMNFKEAIKSILEVKNIEQKVITKVPKTEEKRIIIPEKSETNKEVIEYLKNRGIDEDIIQDCIKNNLIYEEKRTKNVVFLGYDFEGNIKYAGCRSTNNLRIMRDAKGSSKEFSFRLLSNIENDTLHIFESSIDLLSYATLLKIKGYNYQNQNLLSLAGVYQPSKNLEKSKVPIAVQNFLDKNLKTENIVLHFDNDKAGKNATKALIIALNRYNIYDIPAPIGKDINDYLCYKLGLKTRQEVEKYKHKNVQNKGQINER